MIYDPLIWTHLRSYLHSKLTVHPAYIVKGGAIAMNSCELTAAITALANTLARSLTTDELSLLGIVLTQLGDTLTTIAIHREVCCKK